MSLREYSWPWNVPPNGQNTWPDSYLSGGQSTRQISKRDHEYGVSQVFIALDLNQLGEQSTLTQVVHQIIQDYRQSTPASDADQIIYPGQRVLQRRQDHLKNGVPVDTKIWETIQKL